MCMELHPRYLIVEKASNPGNEVRFHFCVQRKLLFFIDFKYSSSAGQFGCMKLFYVLSSESKN